MTQQLQKEAGMDKQIKKDFNCVFENLIHLIMFQSSVLLIATIDVMFHTGSAGIKMWQL